MAKVQNVRQRFDKNGNPTKDKNGNPVWEGRYEVRENGKRKQRSVYASSQKEAKALLDQKTIAIKEKTYLAPSKMTVSKWLDLWLEKHLGKISMRTKEGYESVCKLHIKPYIGNIKLQELTDTDIENKCYDKLKEKGLSPKSIKLVHGAFHRSLVIACKKKDEKGNKYLVVNPSHGIELDTVEKPDIVPLDSEALEKYKKAITGHELENLFIFALNTGLRQSEILGLQWSDVNFSKGTINVKKQLMRNKKESEDKFTDTTKNKKGRIIYPSMFAMSALVQQKKKQQDMKSAADDAWNNKHNLVFTDSQGLPLVHGTVSKNFKRIVTSIGYPNARFHDTRHTFATNYIYSGANVLSVSKSLGHSLPTTTLNIYAHAIAEMENDDINKYDTFMNERAERAEKTDKAV